MPRYVLYIFWNIYWGSHKEGVPTKMSLDSLEMTKSSVSCIVAMLSQSVWIQYTEKRTSCNIRLTVHTEVIRYYDIKSSVIKTSYGIMAMLSKYINHLSKKIAFLKPFCLEEVRRYIIQTLTVTLPIFIIQSIFSKWVYVSVVSATFTRNILWNTLLILFGYFQFLYCSGTFDQFQVSVMTSIYI